GSFWAHHGDGSFAAGLGFIGDRNVRGFGDECRDDGVAGDAGGPIKTIAVEVQAADRGFVVSEVLVSRPVVVGEVLVEDVVVNEEVTIGTDAGLASKLGPLVEEGGDSLVVAKKFGIAEGRITGAQDQQVVTGAIEQGVERAAGAEFFKRGGRGEEL